MRIASVIEPVPEHRDVDRGGRARRRRLPRRAYCANKRTRHRRRRRRACPNPPSIVSSSSPTARVARRCGRSRTGTCRSLDTYFRKEAKSAKAPPFTRAFAQHPPPRRSRAGLLLHPLLAVALVPEELGIHALQRLLRVLLGLLDTCSKEEGGTRRVSKRNLRFRPARRKEKTLATARTDDARTRRTRACSRHIAGGDAADAWPRAIGSCHRGERAHRRTCEPREDGGAMPNDGISPAPSRCIWDPDETPSARRGRRHHSPFLWFL